MPALNATLADRNALLARKLVIIACMMLGFCAALVPFYFQICKVTGISQSRVVAEPSTAAAAASVRDVTVEFLASSNGGLGWTFTALDPIVRVHPGQQTVVRYRVVNTTGHRVVAQAVPSFAPALAAAHFHKVKCFCFDQQVFKAGEARDMQVVFEVAPDLPAEIDRISLSYTFFDVSDEAGGRT